MIQTNVYRALLDLLPKDVELIGEVTAVHGDGTVTVLLPGGGQQRVRGAAASGSKVFFKAGVITGPAADLPVITISE
jgi:hypothetical protein